MSIVFKAKTQEGFTFKILADLLQKCVKNVSFVVEEHGITMCTIDDKGHELIDCVLDKGGFSVYKFTKKIYLGISACHFYKTFKSVKKKDSICMQIMSDDENELRVKIIPSNGSNYAQLYIPISDEVQNIAVDFPTGYGTHILIPGKDYQKACKEMSSISNTIKVETAGHGLFFRSGNDSTLTRNEFLGDDDKECEDENKEKFRETFSTACLSRFMKMAKLADNIQVYAKTGLPLYFRLPVGGLGIMKICIKSHERIAEEEKEYLENMDNEDSD
jgi:proliferating cell nuclear antigen